MLSTRANIMFEKKTWTRLKAISKEQHTTTSELVRRAVYNQYLSSEAKERSEAIKKILEIRPKPVKGKIDYKALINEGRMV